MALLLGYFCLVHEARAQASDASAPSLLTAWQAPAECVSEAELNRSLNQQFAPQAGGPARSLSGKISSGGSGAFQLTFEVHEGGQTLGERTLDLETGSCRSHDETIVLVALLLLEHGPPPPREGEAIPPSEEGAESGAKASGALAEEQQGPGSETESSLALEGFVALAINGGVGPRVSIGPRVGMGLILSEFVSLHILGDLFPRQALEGEGGTLRLGGGRLRARGCAGQRLGRSFGQGCLGLGALSLRGEGVDFPQSGAEDFWTAELSSDIRGGYFIHPSLSLFAEGTFSWAFSKAEFVLEGSGQRLQLYETPRFLMGASVGLCLTF